MWREGVQRIAVIQEGFCGPIWVPLRQAVSSLKDYSYFWYSFLLGAE
jgi:hypothetical protein